MREGAARVALAAAALLLPRVAFAQAVTGSAGTAVVTSSGRPAVRYECIYDLQIEGRISPVRYHVDAKIDGGEVRGEEAIEIDPQGAAKIEDVVLFLFPNVLREPLAGQDSKTFYWVNPARFARGGMALEALTLDDGTPLSWQPIALSRRDDAGNEVRLPGGTAIRAALPAAADGTVK
ncbi:MAG TPA: hypothetical protein VMV18_00880, partial [bacterium]|nr:hypothetical protein [bacterium]